MCLVIKHIASYCIYIRIYIHSYVRSSVCALLSIIHTVIDLPSKTVSISKYHSVHKRSKVFIIITTHQNNYVYIRM